LTIRLARCMVEPVTGTVGRQIVGARCSCDLCSQGKEPPCPRRTVPSLSTPPPGLIRAGLRTLRARLASRWCAPRRRGRRLGAVQRHDRATRWRSPWRSRMPPLRRSAHARDQRRRRCWRWTPGSVIAMRVYAGPMRAASSWKRMAVAQGASAPFPVSRDRDETKTYLLPLRSTPITLADREIDVPSLVRQK
jgi:hypothetical protein